MREFLLTASFILIQIKDRRVPHSEPGGSTGLGSPHMKKFMIYYGKYVLFIIYLLFIIINKLKKNIGK